MHRQEHQPRPQAFLAHLFRDVESAKRRHPDVEHGDVWSRAANHGQRRGAVADGVDDLHVGLRLDDLPQAMAEYRMVVGDDHANVSWHGCPAVHRPGSRR